MRWIKIISVVVFLFYIGLSRMQAQTVTDIDGNVYNTVTIGTQVWMKENLKTTKYNDGTAIPNITYYGDWKALTTDAFCDYDNLPSNSTTYGRLYNWHAIDNNAATKMASNGGRNVCPTGFHVPSDAEWTTLTDYLTNNGYGYEGSGSDIAKSMASTSGWYDHVTPGTPGNDQTSNNSSGFSALPGGYRISNGAFIQIGYTTLWWSSSEYSATTASNRGLASSSSDILSYIDIAQYGLSVRCVMDLSTYITDPSASIIKIYPNPVSGILTIDYKSESFETVTVLNSQGAALIKEKTITARQQLDFSKYVSGLYFLEFSKPSGEIKRLKIIKR